jgi:hypothetical protein
MSSRPDQETEMTKTTARRKLRISPKHVMTGDILVDKPRRGEAIEEIVTWTEQIQPQQWSIETVSTGGTSRAIYAVQRHLTVFRTGPKGLGE